MPHTGSEGNRNDSRRNGERLLPDRTRDNRTTGESECITLTRLFVQKKLEVWPQFVTALIIGSVAHGEARADSDVDCLFVFDDLDERRVPAEFIWASTTDTYRTIFAGDAAPGDVQIDATRLSLKQFRNDAWDEGLRHELARCIVLSDRRNILTPLLAARLAYPDALRGERVQRSSERIAYYLEPWRLHAWMERGGLPCAHDQITAAFEEIGQLLHAYNRVWLPSRHRWLLSTFKLPWLPEGFLAHAGIAQDTASLTESSLFQRHEAIMRIHRAVDARLDAEGLRPDATSFPAMHPQLGYAHNMHEWERRHRELLGERELPNDG